MHRADQAYLTPSTRALLERGDPADYEFPSSQAILDYATHRLLWSWYRRDGDSHLRIRKPSRSMAGVGTYVLVGLEAELALQLDFFGLLQFPDRLPSPARRAGLLDLASELLDRLALV